MKYLTLALVAVVAAKKKCNRDENAKPCADGYQWNQEGCACFSLAKCKKLCPEGEKLSELEMCKCIPLCEYQELFTDDNICRAAKSFNFGTAQEGETCEGFNESTGEPYPECAKDLQCMQTTEMTLPGMGNKCVAKSKEG